MRIALCQVTSSPDPKANLDLVADYAERAASRGASLALFPEATMSCFGVPLGPVAEPLDGPWATAVAGIADRTGLLIAAGMFTPADDDRVRNTLLVTGRGQHLGYHKIHLFDAFGFAESATVAPGDEVAVVEVDDVILGLTVCYDIRFPDLFLRLADSEATVMLVPASWGAGPGKREQWELLVRARALDTTSWVVACGQANPAASGIAPSAKAPTGIGHSLVADPYGHVTGELDAGPGMLVVDVNPSVAQRARRQIPVLANRVL